MSEHPETPRQQWPAVSSSPLAANSASPHLSDEVLAAWTANEVANDEQETVRAHLVSCGYCQNALAQTQRIRALMRAAAISPEALQPAALADRILARLPDQPPVNGETASDASPSTFSEQSTAGRAVRSQRANRRDLWRRLSALAAVLLLIASAALIFTRLSAPTFVPGPPGMGNIPGNWAEVVPSGSIISDIAVISPTDIWVAGTAWRGPSAQALLLHFDGRYWHQSPEGFGGIVLTSISMISPDDGWATGYHAANDEPLMLHYSGGRWHDATTSVDTSGLKSKVFMLSKVRMASATAGWAIGIVITDPGAQIRNQPAQIFQYLRVGDTYRWEPTEALENTQLADLSVVSDHEVWVVGGDNNAKTVIVQITVTYASGTPKSTATTFDMHSWDVGRGSLSSVSMRSSTDGWVAGVNDSSAGILYHWDGKQWSLKQFVEGQYLQTGAGHVYFVQTGIDGLFMTGENEGWVYSKEQQDRGYIYSTTHDQWFSYPVPKDKHIAIGAPLSATSFLAFVETVGDPTDDTPVPVIYDMGNGTPVAAAEPRSP